MSVSTSAKELLERPQRDVQSYDEKPPVLFSTPEIPALHSRIGLPSSFPLDTLRRCLTDPSVEKDHSRHNEALSVIGAGIIDYLVAEYLCTRWPRLPMAVQLSALFAYSGEGALARIAREWGIKSETAKSAETKRQLTEDGREVFSKGFDPGPRLLVDPPKSEEDRIRGHLKNYYEWEFKERQKLAMIESGNRPSKKVVETSRVEESHPKPEKSAQESGREAHEMSKEDEQLYQKQYFMFALQRFVQSIVGGVYVHAVPTSLQDGMTDRIRA